MNRFLIDDESIKKMRSSFTDDEELSKFMLDYLNFIDESFYYNMMRTKAEPQESGIILVKQLFAFASFCREYMDVIHSIVRNMEYREVTEEELKQIIEEQEQKD